MKKLVSSLLLCSVSLLAHSMDMKKVVGSYKVDKLNCGFAVDEVQVSMERSRSGANILELRFEGVDPKTVKLALVSSSVTNIKYPLRSPVRRFITKVEGSERHLKNLQLEELGNRQLILRGEKSLELRESRLIYRQKDRGDMETCVLKR